MVFFKICKHFQLSTYNYTYKTPFFSLKKNLKSMQKLLLLLTFLLATSWVATAQKKAKKEKELVVEYGKIPSEDITMTNYPLDSSAEAVVLAAKGRISVERSYDDGMQMSFTFFRRVKLLKKSAFNAEGNIKIYYYSKDDYEVLRKVKAAVIQSDGIRQELTKKDFFEEKVSAERKATKFAFPNLTEGCTIEYEYEVISKNLTTLHDWEFQENIPVRHSELWLSVPQYYDYIYIFRGRHKLKKTELETYKEDDRTNIGVQKFSTDSVPALKPEKYMTTMSDYLTQITFQLNRVNYPSGRIQEVMSTWKKLAEELNSDNSIGKQYLKKSNYGDVWKAVQPLLIQAKTDDEKIKIIYEYLCTHVNWEDDAFRFWSKESLNDAFKKKKANSGELNMMLIACLNEVDVKAVPMLVSTRGHGKPLTIYPIRDQFNHLVCYIERGEKSLVIDVGNVHRPVGMPRIPTLNGEGWLLDEKNPRWVPIVASLSNEVLLANFKLDDEGTLKGSIASNYRGYAAVSERDNEQDKDKDHEQIRKSLAKDFPDIKIDSITIENLDNTAEPFKRVVYCAIPNAATMAGDLIYIKPSLKTEFDENPFKQPKREYPVEFPYPFKDQCIWNLTIPEGYVVEELPKSIRMTLPENGGTFQYVSNVTGNIIQLIIKIQLEQLHFEPENYEIIKQFFTQIATKSAEQIVLKKKAK
jgi:hypothetical protein